MFGLDVRFRLRQMQAGCQVWTVGQAWTGSPVWAGSQRGHPVPHHQELDTQIQATIAGRQHERHTPLLHCTAGGGCVQSAWWHWAA